ncbi:hypothetical protein GGR25_003691 [Kaistia hirudinis]|uniref:DUF1176 domain-containing protein n=1 Tax=Kaistia hirudinis TaxID=1293440 RepID=A0A840ATR6_9HYPH|nr:DUF1176 domain-containing protein [Kaistia hirudinis]MBB3932633.1 hypothetical protein [Kaistia hirudinis]
MRRLPALVLLLAAFGLAAIDPARAELPSRNTIRHWTAACDNQRACSAYGFATFLDEIMIGAWIRLDRSGAPDAAPELTLAFSLADGGDDTPQSLSLTATGGKHFGPYRVEERDRFFAAAVPGADVPAILALLRKDDILALSVDKSSGGPLAATLSLDGASATLLWLDDQQKRLGTVTALAKKGRKPATAVPPVPPLPVIHAAAPTAEVPQTLPAAVLDLAKNGDCADSMDAIEPIVADLGGGRRLYGALCGAGAYNFAAQFWMTRNGGAPETARFILPPALASNDDEGGGLEEQGILINPFFDEKTMTLVAFAKGRGIGDCGEAQEWVWDGEAFQLSHMSAMGECEGVPSEGWPVLYRAEVK